MASDLERVLALVPTEGGRPKELRFPKRWVERMLERYTDVEASRALLMRLKAMGAKAVVVSTDPLTGERVFAVEWPEENPNGST